MVFALLGIFPNVRYFSRFCSEQCQLNPNNFLVLYSLINVNQTGKRKQESEEGGTNTSAEKRVVK
jgi:hypothetical protein